jgi:hypothetical protein
VREKPFDKADDAKLDTDSNTGVLSGGSGPELGYISRQKAETRDVERHDGLYLMFTPRLVYEMIFWTAANWKVKVA